MRPIFSAIVTAVAVGVSSSHQVLHSATEMIIINEVDYYKEQHGRVRLNIDRLTIHFKKGLGGYHQRDTRCWNSHIDDLVG